MINMFKQVDICYRCLQIGSIRKRGHFISHISAGNNGAGGNRQIYPQPLGHADQRQTHGADRAEGSAGTQRYQ